jgi:hypothetical protein
MEENDPKLGRKFDGGKAEYGLLPLDALHQTVLVLTAGAKKYARDNWKYVTDGERRYFDAAQRHLWAWKSGEENDPETGLPHLAHALCCIMFLNDITRGAEDHHLGLSDTVTITTTESKK